MSLEEELIVAIIFISFVLLIGLIISLIRYLLGFKNNFINPTIDNDDFSFFDDLF
ncbi:hypothetical protein [Tenacibaculum aiptasiae]|uniref:hypothetical protein n=1 Tax=Tenacibaculum aiptasiae TaxID=426481 RepID=UPI0015880A69|nr:hypothetical protein [Tenacibaculum aiptasiae]